MSETIFMIDAWVTAAALAGAMLVAYAAGYGVGRRFPHPSGSGSKGDDASLALLGLLLAFTFAMAMSKHDKRREMVISDSNSIGDFYTCASLLDEPVRSELQQVVREYVALRLSIARDIRNTAEFEQVLDRAQQMQNRMTELVAQALRGARPAPAGNVLVQTLNALTSSHAARLAAAKDRLPGSIVLLLFASAIVAVLIIGRQQAQAGERHIISTVIFSLLVSLVVYVTLDLNQPAKGLITVSQEPMQRLLQSMNSAAPAR